MFRLEKKRQEMLSYERKEKNRKEEEILMFCLGVLEGSRMILDIYVNKISFNSFVRIKWAIRKSFVSFHQCSFAFCALQQHLTSFKNLSFLFLSISSESPKRRKIYLSLPFFLIPLKSYLSYQLVLFSCGMQAEWVKLVNVC